MEIRRIYGKLYTKHSLIYIITKIKKFHLDGEFLRITNTWCSTIPPFRLFESHGHGTLFSQCFCHETSTSGSKLYVTSGKYYLQTLNTQISKMKNILVSYLL